MSLLDNSGSLQHLVCCTHGLGILLLCHRRPCTETIHPMLAIPLQWYLQRNMLESVTPLWGCIQPGQSDSMQLLTSVASPGHVALPPKTGSLHARALTLEPRSQVVEHWDHSPHSCHLLSIAEKYDISGENGKLEEVWTGSRGDSVPVLSSLACVYDQFRLVGKIGSTLWSWDAVHNGATLR